MAVWGYWRTSTDAQDQERQVKALTAAGCERLYGDKITGTSNYGDREQLSRCLDGLRANDLLVLDELSRLGRSMVEMLVEVNALLERDVAIKTLDGRLDTTAMDKELVKLIVGVMGYAAEMELKHLKRRTAEGRAVARSRGVKFGRKRSYTPSRQPQSWRCVRMVMATELSPKQWACRSARFAELLGLSRLSHEYQYSMARPTWLLAALPANEPPS